MPLRSNKHYRYAQALFRHKRYVFQACRYFKVPLLSAIFHDWDKFTYSMWTAYANYFYAVTRNSDGTYSRNENPSNDFDMAWNAHQKRNKHHWQYWLLNEDSGNMKVLPIPEHHAREMLADWVGAGKAYSQEWDTHKPLEWYEKNKHKMLLHPDTRMWVEQQLKEFSAVTHYG